MSTINKKKLVLGITSPGSTPLIRGQANYFVKHGFEVYLMAPMDPRVTLYCEKEECKHLPVNLARDISIYNDLISFFKILFYFIKIKPDIVNVGTPKIGLLGSLAARVCGIKKRIYTCRGFRYEHEKGLKKKLLMLTEKVASNSVHIVICISNSLKKKGVDDKIFSEQKAIVFGVGSSNGIDLKTFDPSTIKVEVTKNLKDRLNLNNRFVFGFVGRLIDRKGIKELYNAFIKVNEIHQNTSLVLLGTITQGQLSDGWLIEKFEEHPNIHWLGFQSDVPLYMSIFDILVLPAWWEGFGNVLIQAAAMGVPVISTNVTGCKDAVNNGFNGILIPSKDEHALYNTMLIYLQNDKLRYEHGLNGKSWASKFASHTIWQKMLELYTSG